MPKGRVMVEGTLLPDGTVAFMNGAGVGAQGYAEPEVTAGQARYALFFNETEAQLTRRQ